jgi:hypothetical protein
MTTRRPVASRPYRRPRAPALALVAALLALLGGGVPLHADWEPATLVSDGTQDALHPRIATRSGPGDYVHVVWVSYDGTKLMYRRSLSGGATWYPITTLYTGDVVKPHIAATGNTVHVVWRGDAGDIMYLRSTSNGGTWDAPVVLSDDETDGNTPDVAASGDHVIVTWLTFEPDVAYVESTNNGNTWQPIGQLTTDAGSTNELAPRAAASGSYLYVVWLEVSNVVFRRKGTGSWEAPLTLFTGDSSHVSIAAHASHVFVDRNDPLGPVQRLSTDWGLTWSSIITLGTGDEKPEVSASQAYASNAATVFLDTRDSVHRVFVSTAPVSETQIATHTGSVRNADIAVMKNGDMHVVRNSSGYRDIYYHKFNEPPQFRWWWSPPTGVALSDSQWGDFDGDGDLDLVLAGDTVPQTDMLVTRTYENVGAVVPLVLKQGLDGVKSQSSGNLAWGDYDGDGDLDLVVTGADASSTPTARVYGNDGLGNLTLDTGQTLTAVSSSAAAWGDVDNDGDLDLVVTGLDATLSSSSILYENDPLGTLAPHPTITLVDVRNGSADWADWDDDGDLDLMLSGHDGTSRRVLFYENDGAGGLASPATKGLYGVNLSDAAFGDFDADGDLDLICTGDRTGAPPPASTRTLTVYENDGAGNFSEYDEPMQIYRSSAAWGDYDNDGDLDFAACGYTGGTLYTRIYEKQPGGFVHVDTKTGVREGSVDWADVDQDGALDFFVTGFDFGNVPYADLYRNVGRDPNSAPNAPTTLTCAKAYRGMEIGWTGASDAETPAPGLYYVLRVGTTSGGHDVVSGTYATPLMGNVGQATSRVLDLPADTYYWSVRTVDSGFMTSMWTTEQTCQHCPPDFGGNGIVDFNDLLQVLSKWGPCTECLEDLDRDGTVGFQDLLIVLASWGTCP